LSLGRGGFARPWPEPSDRRSVLRVTHETPLGTLWDSTA
jgi:hypothetical protein